MSCENCSYFSSNGKYSKGYCSYYRAYYYPEDSCSHENSNNSSGGCYLTSACVKCLNLPDDCIELETLRKFRDTWLINQPFGKADIEEYYSIAPSIVKSINENKESNKIWTQIYDELVTKSVILINNKQYNDAYELYKSYSLKLKNTFSN